MVILSEQETEFLVRSLELARRNIGTNQGGPFGAVIVREGVIVAEGTNVVTQTWDPTAHAEIVAIRAACRDLSNFRLDDCVIFSSCEPCPMCLAAIHWSRIGRIVFAATRHDAARAGFDDEFLYEELQLPLAERSIPTDHVRHPDAQMPFLAWQVFEEKVAY